MLWPVDGGVAVSEGTAFLQILLPNWETRGWGDRETEEIGGPIYKGDSEKDIKRVEEMGRQGDEIGRQRDTGNSETEREAEEIGIQTR